MRTPTAQKQKKSARQAQNWLAENPLVALFVVFLALFLLTGAVQPNFLSINGVRNTLLQAAQFVQTLEARQGLRICCPEEICWRNGWIDDAQLEKLGSEIGKSQYGQYLLHILKHRD